jgi:hypothetical protein
MLRHMDAHAGTLRGVIVDLSTSPYVDLAGTRNAHQAL